VPAQSVDADGQSEFEGEVFGMLGEDRVFPVKREILANEDRSPTVQLSRKDLSWLFRKPMAKRHPSKPELRSITPSMRIPSDETAFLLHHANLAKAEGFRPGRIGFIYGTGKIAR
jgi:hypothetical protein